MRSRSSAPSRIRISSPLPASAFPAFAEAAQLRLILDIRRRRVERAFINRNADVVGLDDASQLHIDRFHDGLRRDVVLRVVSLLFFAAASRSRRWPDSSNRSCGPRRESRGPRCGARNGRWSESATSRCADSLLCRHPESPPAKLPADQPFAQKVDADQHIEFAAPQIAQNLDALERLDFRVQIPASHADFREIFRQDLRTCAWSAW